MGDIDGIYLAFLKCHSKSIVRIRDLISWVWDLVLLDRYYINNALCSRARSARKKKKKQALQEKHRKTRMFPRYIKHYKTIVFQHFFPGVCSYCRHFEARSWHHVAPAGQVRAHPKFGSFVWLALKDLDAEKMHVGGFQKEA